MIVTFSDAMAVLIAQVTNGSINHPKEPVLPKDVFPVRPLIQERRVDREVRMAERVIAGTKPSNGLNELTWQT